MIVTIFIITIILNLLLELEEKLLLIFSIAAEVHLQHLQVTAAWECRRNSCFTGFSSLLLDGTQCCLEARQTGSVYRSFHWRPSCFLFKTDVNKANL